MQRYNNRNFQFVRLWNVSFLYGGHSIALGYLNKVFFCDESKIGEEQKKVSEAY